MAPGVCWSESVRGTNALGTALAESQPMLINCGEHFLERLDSYSCSSVLLNDGAGSVSGVLSLARKGKLSANREGLLMLEMAASYINRRLFIGGHPNDFTLAVHCGQGYWTRLAGVTVGQC